MQKQWESVQGGITRRVDEATGDKWVVFWLAGRDYEGHGIAQRVELPAQRLKLHPWRYGYTLDMMVRDLTRYGVV